MKKRTKIILISLKIIFKIIAIIVILLVPVIAVLLIPPVGFAVVQWIKLPNPPEPTIRYGEFPFELVYEIDGEIVTVNDVYICEYTGIALTSECCAKERSWKGYVKSSRESGVFLTEDKTEEGTIKIYCSVGSARIYMDDERYGKTSGWTPKVYSIETTDRTSTTCFLGEEIMEKYHIKLISWKFSDPIENTFE